MKKLLVFKLENKMLFVFLPILNVSLQIGEINTRDLSWFLCDFHKRFRERKENF